jgi:hypothetical protein
MSRSGIRAVRDHLRPKMDGSFTLVIVEEEERRRGFEQMKLGLHQIIELLPNGTTDAEEAEHTVLKAISDFVDRYLT